MIDVLCQVVKNYRDCDECGDRIKRGEKVILVFSPNGKNKLRLCCDCAEAVGERIGKINTNCVDK